MASSWGLLCAVIQGPRPLPSCGSALLQDFRVPLFSGEMGKMGKKRWASLECGDITASHMATPHFKGSRGVPRKKKEHRFCGYQWPSQVLTPGSLSCLFKTYVQLPLLLDQLANGLTA